MGVSLGKLDEMVSFQLRRAHNVALRELDVELGALDVTTAMMGTLEVVRSNEGISQGQVAEVLGLNRSTMVPIIEKLCERGSLVRERTPQDRRTILLTITQTGVAELQQLWQIVEAHEKKLLKALGEDARAGVLTGLQRLVQAS